MTSTRIDKLNEWRELRTITPKTEDPEIEAGRKAEKFLNQLIESNLKYKGAYCFLNKRIPSARHKRKYEVDLIVVTKKQIHFLEVKNWSGGVYQDKNKWIQVKRNGDKLEHPDFVNHNSFKQQIVKEFLKINGLKIADSYFKQKVIFMNPRLHIDSSISQNPNIVPYDKINHYLRNQKGTHLGEQMLHSIVEICLAQEKSKVVLDGLFQSLNKNDLKRMIKLFTNLHSWDKLGMFGEKIVTGDVIKLIINNQPYNISNYPINLKIDISWSRNKYGGLLKALVFNGEMGRINLNGKKIPISTQDKVLFHKAGEKKPEYISLSNVDYIIKG